MPTDLTTQNNNKPATRKPLDVLGDDFYIKSIRSDKLDFFRTQAIYGFTRTKTQQMKFKLRRGGKKLFTVDGDGVYKRAEKKPHYTQDKKLHFSQIQSFTLVLKDVQPPVYGHNKERERKLVAVAIHKKDILPSKRLYIYDGGTINRPYDFYTQTDAETYYKNKVASNDPILFAKMKPFKKAIQQPQHKDKYNEVLVRARWNTDSSHILIASDSLEARLIAQDRARILRNRLKEQAKESGDEWDENYQVPIGFYMPDSPQHMRTYTRKQQAKDKKEALDIYAANASRRTIKYSNNDYEFLLALDNPIAIFSETYSGDNTPLLNRMLNEGYAHIVHSLLDKIPQNKINKIKVTGDFTAAIDHAFTKGDYETVNWLKSKGYDLLKYFQSTFAHSKNTPLEAIKYFIDHYLDAVSIEYVNNSHESMLYKLCEDGDLHRVKLLLEKGAEVDQVCTDSGVSPLYVAAQNGHLEIVKLLLANHANADLEAIKYIIDHYLDAVSIEYVNNSHESMLYKLCQDGDLHRVKLILEKGAEVDQVCTDSGVTPLYVAAQNGHLEIVKLLLANHANADFVSTKKGVTPLFIAAQNGHLEIVKLLLANHANVDQARHDIGITPLYIAAEKGHLEIVKLLLANHADVDRKDTNNGATLLHIAALNGHLEIVNLLIKAGAEYKADRYGLTPYNKAKQANHYAICEALKKFQLKFRLAKYQEKILNQTSNYKHSFTLFGHEFHFGVSKDKLEKTVRAMNEVIDGKKDYSTLKEYNSAIKGNKKLNSIYKKM